ncbi:hypothetical protein NTGM5_280013 [Candidatus Nitrotoga sp. M5]|nr:hypothetical protein NTGM5_280013 [Candidatus Nitrotoga sp. M5]
MCLVLDYTVQSNNSGVSNLTASIVFRALCWNKRMEENSRTLARCDPLHVAIDAQKLFLW